MKGLISGAGSGGVSRCVLVKTLRIYKISIVEANTATQRNSGEVIFLGFTVASPRNDRVKTNCLHLLAVVADHYSHYRQV